MRFASSWSTKRRDVAPREPRADGRVGRSDAGRPRYGVDLQRRVRVDGVDLRERCEPPSRVASRRPGGRVKVWVVITGDTGIVADCVVIGVYVEKQRALETAIRVDVFALGPFQVDES